MNIKEFLEKENIGEVRVDEELTKHTTYRVGGKCNYFVQPSSIDNLIKLIKFLKENNIKYKVLGNGSNVIVSSNVFNGVIISLTKLNNVEIDGEYVTVEAGFSVIKLSNYLANNYLGGFEFASGIPAQIGGAVYMNAGAYKSDMSEVIEEVTFIDENCNLVTLPKEKLDFSYRHSIFQDKDYIVVRVKMKLYKVDDRDEILTLMNDRRQRRIETQPLEYPSAGSVFRNPAEDIYAGKLIEDLGLKGYSIGGAKISEKHANFIVNYNNATAEDIKKLIDLIKEKVKEKYNIDLMVEQEFVNFGD